jgi:hypothetical protein
MTLKDVTLHTEDDGDVLILPDGEVKARPDATPQEIAAVLWGALKVLHSSIERYPCPAN